MKTLQASIQHLPTLTTGNGKSIKGLTSGWHMINATFQ